VRKDGSRYSRPASKHEKPWTEAVRQATLIGRPEDVGPPYAVTIAFFHVRPARPKYGWPVSSDVDKLVRGTLDGLVPRILSDDRHVIDLRVRECWSDLPQDAGALVIVERAELTSERVEAVRAAA